MISFETIDIFIILFFFVVVLFIGLYFSGKTNSSQEGYFLFNRNVGLFLFVTTNVSTWYGGILGVGEFTYLYGLASWFTQGLPYYIFAILFAFFFAEKIRETSLFTIPEKIEFEYGKTPALISALFIFMLVSPAPYLFMTASLVSLTLNIDLFYSLLIASAISSVYLFNGGFKADLITDIFHFFIMFAGFIIIFISAYNQLGDIDYIVQNVPENLLSFSGGKSFSFILVWYLIALWTFADPGFHQRCYAAKSGNTAKYGILISIVLWFMFDFLTTSVGLYSKAALPDITDPVNAFPLLAEKILSPGLKGFFYAALFATILSTMNSFIFLSASTFGRDIASRFTRTINEKKSIVLTKSGLVISIIISILLAYFIRSVVELWYLIGSILIPGIIFPVIGAYYNKLKISTNYTIVQMILGFLSSLTWYFLRDFFSEIPILRDIEPMIFGLLVCLIIHISGMIKLRMLSFKN